MERDLSDFMKPTPPKKLVSRHINNKSKQHHISIYLYPLTKNPDLSVY